MKALQDPLWSALESFEFDEAGAMLPFSARLARDNGWTSYYAARVIDEYRRFLYLAVRAGHAVTPSDAVDQAWHLHLCYSRSYWEALCGEILKLPLHHGPTEGGQAEGERYREQYEATLRSYYRLFGVDAPADIWPACEERFGEDVQFARVNVAKRSTLHALCSGAIARELGACGGVSLAAVCALLLFAVSHVEGAVFLVLYVVCWLMCAALNKHRLTSRFSRELERTAPNFDRNTPLNEIELAYLRGGQPRLVATVLAASTLSEKVGFAESNLDWPGAPQGICTYRKRLLLRPELAKASSAQRVAGTWIDTTALVEWLELRGLLRPALTPTLTVLALATPLVGLVRVVVGGARGEAVGLLIMLVVVGVLAVALRRTGVRTSLAEALVKEPVVGRDALLQGARELQGRSCH